MQKQERGGGERSPITTKDVHQSMISDTKLKIAMMGSDGRSKEKARITGKIINVKNWIEIRGEKAQIAT